MAKKIKPNVVAGGSAIDLGNGLFYMRGRTHKQGGIDIGKNPETGIEVENGEIYDIYKGRVFSAQPIFNGISPANALLMGGNPNSIFNAQEAWKQVNRVTDDGRKFETGGDNENKKRGAIAYGTPDDTRIRYLNIDQKLLAYINYLSKQYNISPALLANRLSNEGIIDSYIRTVDFLRDEPMVSILDRSEDFRSGFEDYGLDDTFSLYEQGKLNLRRKIPFTKLVESNEKGRTINSVEVENPYDGIELVAANLEYLSNSLKKKFPNLKGKDLDIATSKAYNMGLYGAIDDITKNGIGTRYNIDNRYYNLNYNNDIYNKNKNRKNIINLYTTEDQTKDLIGRQEYYIDRYNDAINSETPKLTPPPGMIDELAKEYSLYHFHNGDYKHNEPFGTDFSYNNPFFDVPFTFKYGGIHIKPSKRGTFTAAAKRHNMGVQEFARTVLNNKANYSAAMVKKANFARNASKWHKKEFGGDMTKQYFITPNNIYKLGGDIRKKAALGTDGNNYERFIDGDGLMKYRIGNTVYSKDGFSRVTGMSLDEIDSYFDAIDNEGRGEITPSIVTATRRPLTSESSITPSIVTASRPSNNKSFVSKSNIEPSVATAYNRARPGIRQNTIGFTDSLAGTSYYGPQRTNELPAPQVPTQSTQPAQPATPQRSQYSTIRIDTSGRPTRGLGVTPLRPYDGRPIETQAQTPASGSQSPSTGGQRRTTRSSVPTTPIIPIDYDSIDKQINESNQRILRESLYNPYPTLEPLATITSPGAVTPQTIVDNNRRNPVKLRGNGINIRNGADWLGLGINLAGNLASSLINRNAIKSLNYGDAPIPLSAQKLKTNINVNPQLDQIRENVAGQERLIADNTADSRVSLARRQRARNFGTEQFQSLMGQKENMETQLINRDRLNRQGIDAQNVTQYNQWRRGAYDFENRRREMLAENAVAGINNAAEAIAGERGILARREGRNRDILNAALIAATSPNAQNVIGSEEFAKFLEKLRYTGDFSLLHKRLI